MNLTETLREVRDEKKSKFPSLSSFSPLNQSQPIDLAGTLKQIRQERIQTTPQTTEENVYKNFTKGVAELSDVSSRTIQSSVLEIPKAFATMLRIATEPRQPNQEIAKLAEKHFPNIKQPEFKEPDKFLGIDISAINRMEDKFRKVVSEPLNRKSLDIIDILNKKQQEIIKPIFDEKPRLSNWKEYLYTIESGAVSLGEAVGITLITKNSNVGAGFLSSLEASDIYNKARSDGFDHQKSLKTAAESGIGTFVLEKIGIDYLFALGGASKLASAFKSSLFETAQEELQTVWQNLVRKKNLDKTQKLFEGWFETAIGISIPSFLAGLVIPGLSFNTRRQIVGEMAKEAGVSEQKAETAWGEMIGITRKSLEQFRQSKFVPGLTIKEVGEEPEDLSETIKKVREERERKPQLEFFRLAKGKEAVSPTEQNKAFQSMPDREGYEKVFMPYGEQGKGFYYQPLKNSILPSPQPPAKEFGETQDIQDVAEEPIKLSAEEAFQEAEAGVLMELEISQKGERIFLDTGEVKGVSSTFPKFIPEDLRRKELFDKVIKMNIEGKKPRGARQARLMDIISQEIINRMDVSLADEKATNDFLNKITERAEKEQNQFLKELEKNIVKGIREKRFTIKQVVKMSETAKKKGFKLGAREAREKILTQVRLKQGKISDIKQQIVDYANAFLPKDVRGELLSYVKNATKFEHLEKAKTRIQEIGEKSDIANIKKEIGKQLSDIKPRKQAGKPRGKFTPFHQKVLDGIKEATKLTEEQAEVIIAENLKQIIVAPETAIQNKILDTFSGLNEKNSSELQAILDTITGIKEDGRISNELQKFNISEQLDKKANMVVDYATNFKGLPKAVETTGKIQKTTNQNLRVWLKSLGKRWIMNWSGLMKIITFNSPLSKQPAFLDTFSILANENAYKVLQSDYIKNFNEAMSRAYAIENKPNLIRKKIIESNKLINLGMFRNSEGVEVELKFTKAEIMKLWAEFQDKSLDESFSEGNHFTPEIKQAITNSLSKEDIAFVKEALNMWQDQWQIMNPVFSNMNGVDLTHNDKYSPIRRVGFKIDSEKGLGEFVEEATYRRAVSPRAIKTRVKNLLPIEKQNIFEALDRHFTETNYYVAWAEKIRELDIIFKDKNVRFALEDNYGKNFILTVNNTINDISTRGNKWARRYAVLDFFRKNFTVGALMIKPVIAVKQFISVIAYGEILTPQDFALGVIDFWKNPIENAKILNEESVMIRERSSNLERDIKAAIKSDVFNRYSVRQNFINTLMLNVTLGDKGAVLTGSWAIRKVRLKQGIALEEVIKEYESFSSETQQSSDLSQLSEIQRGGSFEQLFTMFKSSPRQFLAKEVSAVRSLFQEGGTSKQNIKRVAKTLVIYHIILPVFFQFVSNFGGWDEDDLKEYARAGLLGSLNGLFLFGDIVDGITRIALGLKPFDTEVPIATIGDDVQRAIRELDIGDIDTEDVVNAIQEFIKTGNALGIPVEQTMNMGAGIKNLIEGNTKEGIGLLIGWSPYALKMKKEKSLFPELPKFPKFPELPKLPKLP